ncbi:MAG: ATP-binding protein [Sphaerochaeta sp.]|nr:ATP-binding protein [Sphaerochaeta sp.]
MDYSAIFVPLITLLISQALVFDLGRFRFPKKRLLIIFGIQLLVIVTISSMMLIAGGLTIYAKWYVLVMVVPAFSTFLYISNRRDARDVFTIVTTIFINFLISIPAMWFTRFHRGGYVHYNLARLVLFAVVFFLIHVFSRKQYLLIQDEIEKGWAIFSILPLLGSVILYYGYIQYGQTGSFMEILYILSFTTVFIASVYVVIFYLFQQLLEKYMVQEQRRILAMQNKAQLDQHILFKEAAESSNRRWHDLRHTTQTLIGLLESGQTPAALEYLKDHMGLESVIKEEYCLHPAVNSILCLWAERARKADISMEILVALPETLAIEPLELSALFANAIENAYHACLALAEDVQRFIKVESHYSSRRLAIGITNTCSEDVHFEGGMPISFKEGGGIGTRSMVYTVNRFQGAYSFGVEDGLFFSRFVLNV